MSAVARTLPVAASFILALLASGCASAPATRLAAGEQASIEGSIVSIDTQPWTYDGNAAVVLDTREHGQVAVQLPARWNLCQAAAVDVQALAAGMKARAVGTVGAEGEVVVCERESHRLEPVR
jgi:hypothetical protein